LILKGKISEVIPIIEHFHPGVLKDSKILFNLYKQEVCFFLDCFYFYSIHFFFFWNR